MVLPAKVTLTDAQGNPLVLQAGAAGLYIVNPAANPDGNVYASFQAAAAAAKASGPGTELLLVADVTAEALAIDLTGVKVRGLGVNGVTLTLPDGCTLVDTYNDFFFENVTLSFTGSHPVFTVGAGNMAISLTQYANLRAENSSTNGMIAIPAGYLYLNAFFANILHGSSGHPLVKLSATGNLLSTLGNGCQLDSDTITGGASGAATIIDGSAHNTGTLAAAIIDQSQTGLTAPTWG